MRQLSSHAMKETWVPSCLEDDNDVINDELGTRGRDSQVVRLRFQNSSANDHNVACPTREGAHDGVRVERNITERPACSSHYNFIYGHATWHSNAVYFDTLLLLNATALEEQKGVLRRHLRTVEIPALIKAGVNTHVLVYVAKLMAHVNDCCEI
jgi:hypothetical protein